MAADGMAQAQQQSQQSIVAAAGQQMAQQFKSPEQQAADLEQRRLDLELRRSMEAQDARNIISYAGGAAWNVVQCAVAASIIIGLGYAAWRVGSRAFGGPR